MSNYPPRNHDPHITLEKSDQIKNVYWIEVIGQQIHWPFAKWNTIKDEISIGTELYTRIEEYVCLPD